MLIEELGEDVAIQNCSEHTLREYIRSHVWSTNEMVATTSSLGAEVAGMGAHHLCQSTCA